MRFITICRSCAALARTGGRSLPRFPSSLACSAIAGHPDLVLKLHEVATATLGSSMAEALSLSFDAKLAHSSLRLYSLRDVPAIRGTLPPGVSDVHFRSDLSGLAAKSVEELVGVDAGFEALLPGEDL